MNTNNGISLIVLVITIIVIIILAGSVILSLSDSNPISNANEAKFKSNISQYNSELTMVISNKYLQDNSFDPNNFNAGEWNGIDTNKLGTIKEYISSITIEDGKKYEIQSGRLVYTGVDETEIDWLIDTGITNTTLKLYTLTKPLLTDVNKYKTPYIPTGFRYKEGTWNNGLVIQDNLENEFVWVPVDGTNVPYAKWCTKVISWNNSGISDDIILSNTIVENTQVNTYGGFYIARYEAGNVSNTLVSKKGVTVWNIISYADSKIKAEAMYVTPEVKSGLVTGKQWDTTMEWIKDSGKNVIDSITWGNYSNSIEPGSGVRQVTGFNENWKANNIYDLAGNTYEWINEKYSTYHILRGGSYSDNGSTYSAASRINGPPGSGGAGMISFRVVLYIL